MAKFEVVSKYADAGIPIPVRSTAQSAGYDFIVAEDIVVPTYADLMGVLSKTAFIDGYKDMTIFDNHARMLDEIATMTKAQKAKPTLVSTGLKCKLNPDEYLEIVARSSTPLKYWLIVANAPGIVDADYYNNPDNEGEIFVQIINLSPFPIHLQKGEKIAQGLIQKYVTTEDDTASGARVGGFGSTTK